MTSIPRVGRRELERVEQTLQVRDTAVLRDVQRFRLLTGSQLQRLHFGLDAAAARAARRCLLRLTNLRLLTRLSRRVGGVRAGSEGYVYALGPVGNRLLGAGMRVQRDYEVGDGFLLHTLGIGDVMLRLVSDVRDGRGLLEVCQPEPESWRRIQGTGMAHELLKPDLFVVTSAASITGVVAQHSWVELDRGTEHRAALLRKLEQYERAWQLGLVGQELAVFPRVVWLVPDPSRRDWLRRLIASTARVSAQLHTVQLVGELEALWPPGSSPVAATAAAAPGQAAEQLVTEGGDHG